MEPKTAWARALFEGVTTITAAMAHAMTKIPTRLPNFVAEPVETSFAAMLVRMCEPPASSSPGLPNRWRKPGSRYPRADENVKPG
jgi:hypothetical protein